MPCMTMLKHVKLFNLPLISSDEILTTIEDEFNFSFWHLKENLVLGLCKQRTHLYSALDHCVLWGQAGLYVKVQV